MKSFIILSVVLGILASNGVHGVDFRNYRMLSLNKPLDSGFMPMFNTEQRMAPQSSMIMQEQRMAPQPSMIMSEQRMAPQSSMIMQEQRMAPQPSMIMPEQRMINMQTMQVPQQQISIQTQQRIEKQQMLEQQMQQQNMLQQQQLQQQQLQQQQLQQQQLQQQQLQMQQQQLAQKNKQVFQKPTVGRQINSQESFCQGRNPDTIIGHPSDPTKFIACHSGNDFDIMSCPNGLIFNTGMMRCDVSRTVKGCATNPCRNGGVCTDTASGMYQCSCPAGFMGINCERDDHCMPNSCGPDGVCVPLGAGSPLGHYCICSSGKSFGMACDSNVEENPCSEKSSDSLHFPVKANPSIFIHCDGVLPNLKFCPWPLTFNVNKQECDWRS